MVLLNTVKCLIIRHCGIMFYPVLYSWGKNVVIKIKGLIIFEKGVKKEQKRDKNKDLNSGSFRFGPALATSQKYCVNSTINKEKP